MPEHQENYDRNAVVANEFVMFKMIHVNYHKIS